MQSFIYDFLFIITSIFVLFKAIGYGIYEIKQVENKSGGICVITFSILVVIFFDIIILLKWKRMTLASATPFHLRTRYWEVPLLARTLSCPARSSHRYRRICATVYRIQSPSHWSGRQYIYVLAVPWPVSLVWLKVLPT